MSTTLIMGGTGFIGIEATKALVERGDRVYGLARSAESSRKLRELGAIPIQGDVYEPQKWLGSMPRVDYVINALGFFTDGKPARLSLSFAAKCHEKYTSWANVLLQVVRHHNVRAAVHVTGTAIFEESPLEWITEQTPLCDTLTGFNRIAWSAARLMIDAIAGGLPIVVAVAPNVVYGPLPNSSFQKIFVDPLRSNMIGIVGNGKNYVPTGHARDVGRAIAFLTDGRYAKEFFLIAGDDAVTQKEMLYAIARAMGKQYVMQLPKSLVSILGGKAASEFMSLSQRVDNSKLKKAGFVMHYPRFTEAIGPVMEELRRSRALVA
jgi:nucleoside-diphosphate-sugar epimerase